MDHFNALLIASQFRPRILRLPVLSTGVMHLFPETETQLSIPELQRAYVVLSFLAHGYLIGIAKHDEIISILPPQIAIPWFNVSHQLGVKPVISYAGVDLWNWYRLDPEAPLNLENLAMRHTFTGSFDEAWYLALII